MDRYAYGDNRPGNASVAYVVETKDDESLLGLVVNETATSVTLRQAYGKENVIPRANLTSMKSQAWGFRQSSLVSVPLSVTGFFWSNSAARE